MSGCSQLGVGKGVVGVIVKPVAGMLEAASLAATGIQGAASKSVVRGTQNRRRYPRLFYGSQRAVKPYSVKDAMIYDALMYLPEVDW